jgi:hypothetical protein
MKSNSKILENANLGKNSWWRFTLSIVTIVFFYLLGGFINVLVAVYLNDGNKPKHITEFIEGHSNVFVSTIAFNLEFIVGCIGILLAVKFIHKRKFISLITTSPKINKNKLEKYSLGCNSLFCNLYHC